MRRPVDSLMRRRGLVLVFCAMLVMSVFPAATFAHPPAGGDLSVPPTGDPELNPYLQPGRAPLDEETTPTRSFSRQNDAMVTRRTAGDERLTIDQAGQARAAAAKAGKTLKKTIAASRRRPSPRHGPRSARTRSSRSPEGASASMPWPDESVRWRSARATARRSWAARRAGSGPTTKRPERGSARTDDQSTLSIGAIAIAPSNDSIVYAGTGEGNLSGDSYFGNGFLKSTDGGIHWAHVGGKTFQGVSISKLVVDPSTIRLRVCAAVSADAPAAAGRRRPNRRSTASGSRHNGGVTWKNIRKVKDELHGATDLVEDPTQPNILYAAFWADGIYRSTDFGKHWTRFMAGIPANATFGTGGGTRFALGISHPAGQPSVLYAGFEWTIGTASISHRGSGSRSAAARGRSCRPAPNSVRQHRRATAARSASTTT